VKQGSALCRAGDIGKRPEPPLIGVELRKKVGLTAAAPRAVLPQAQPLTLASRACQHQLCREHRCGTGDSVIPVPARACCCPRRRSRLRSSRPLGRDGPLVPAANREPVRSSRHRARALRATPWAPATPTPTSLPRKRRCGPI